MYFLFLFLANSKFNILSFFYHIYLPIYLSQTLSFIRNDPVGEIREDTQTNASIVLSENTGINLTSVLTFNYVRGEIHNNTIVVCSDSTGDSSNITIVMAGNLLAKVQRK